MEFKLTFCDNITNRRDALVALGDTLSRLSQGQLLIEKSYLLDQITSQNIDLPLTAKTLYVEIVEAIFISLKKSQATLEQLATEIFCQLKPPKPNQESKQVMPKSVPQLQTHRRGPAAVTRSLHSNFGGFSSRGGSLKMKGKVCVENPENTPSITEIEKQLKKLALELTSDPLLVEFSTGLCRDNFIKMALSYINVKPSNQEKRAAYMDLQEKLEASLTSQNVSFATCTEIIAILDKQLPPEAQTPRRSSSHF